VTTSVVALDVGGTGIKCAVVDTTGAVRHTERHPTGRERGSEAVVETILDIAEGLVATARGLGLTPAAVGIVVPASSTRRPVRRCGRRTSASATYRCAT
jgi:glucokinase